MQLAQNQALWILQQFVGSIGNKQVAIDDEED
jgi:hypothetical protein